MLSCAAGCATTRPAGLPGASSSRHAGDAIAPQRETGRDEPVIRIALSVGASETRVSCEGELRVWRQGSGRKASVFPAGTRFVLTVSDGRVANEGGAPAPGVRLSREVPASKQASKQASATQASAQLLGVFPQALIFEAKSSEHPLLVSGKPYRGEIVVRPVEEGLVVANVLRIEAYLRGVVPLEMGASESIPMSALQAQAIAARSYALHYFGRREKEAGCDLLAGTEDQVYGGVEAERARTDEAVSGTRGVVALHEGKPIRANYCSTCGGATEANERAWPGQEAVAYLRGTRDKAGSDLCAASPYFRWREQWEWSQLEAIVLARLPEEVPEARGKSVGRLRDLQVVARSPSGRAERLRVVTDGGDFLVPGDRIRRVVRRADGGLLWSTDFERFHREGKDPCRVTLEGRGFGHGVGMCQYGAMEFGRKGADAGRILRHYYRGVQLACWW